MPERNADVHAEVGGFIDQVLVQEGQTVRSGDELATISGRDLEAQRKEVAAQIQAQEAKLLLLVNGPRPQEITVAQDAVATATSRAQFARQNFDDQQQLRAQRLSSAEAALNKAETEHTFAQKNLRRYEQLWQAGLTAQKGVDDAQESVAVTANEEKVAAAALEMVRSDSLAQAQGDLAVSEKELAEAQARLRTLLAGSRAEEIAAARAELARLQAERDFLDHQIGLTKVVSPVAGVVATHRTQELLGKFVQRGDLILKVDETKTITAEMSIPEQEVETLRVGQPVALRTAAYPGMVFNGKVTSIAPQVSPPDAQQLERQFLVDTDLDNSRDLLKPGMSGAAKIYCGKRSPFELGRTRAARFFRVEFWSWW
ncbi:MAG TPA: efflux RND transporter periplasmic adaptor subunit [Terriglobia bacterium]|nr:efflux RND transporter periplasmic adaptor subunit [Terriglobia bacterium]